MTSRLDDTTNCPTAEACAGCEATDDLAVNTYDTPSGGVFCRTMCGPCTDNPRIQMSLGDWMDSVLAHCEHLGLDLDEAGAIAEAEREASRA